MDTVSVIGRASLARENEAGAVGGGGGGRKYYLSGVFRFRDTKIRQIGIVPAAESVFTIIFTFPVPKHYDSGGHLAHIQLTAIYDDCLAAAPNGERISLKKLITRSRRDATSVSDVVADVHGKPRMSRLVSPPSD